MKKLLILFGLNDLVLGLYLVWSQLTGKEQFDFALSNIFLWSCFALFMVAAVGLPLRNRFAWSANFILNAIVVVIAPYITYILLEFGAFDISRYGQSQGIRLLGFYIVIGVAFFSIVRTLKQDITQLLQITLTQKRLTVIAGLLICVLFGWFFIS